MRTTETFPAGDIRLLKKQVVTWAGNFFCCTCMDNNGYRSLSEGRDFIAAAGMMDSISGINFFTSLKNNFDAHADWLFGFLSYDLRRETEPEIFTPAQPRFDGIAFPNAFLFRPLHIIEIAGGRLTIHSTADPHTIYHEIISQVPVDHPHTQQFTIRHRTTKEEYLHQVAQIKRHIAAGDLYEMNLCQEFYDDDAVLLPAPLFHRLSAISPAPFSCFVKRGDKFLLCASPERFLMKQGNRLTAQPMKGTIRRSHDAKDESLKHLLATDPKEQAENVMIVDLVRNDLARSAQAGTVKVEELFGIYSFPQVHQMVSTISATLHEHTHFADAIRHAFPMGSMTGAPKVMAMHLIDTYEKVERGLFSGSVGFITPSADFDFNVVIRSILYNASARYLSFLTGSAITHDCSAEKEYDECLLKAGALLKALNA